jgi:very-short-patch-repair endonuclease
MDGEGETRERRLAELVARQHGVAALWQLRDLGYAEDVVWNRLATNRLFRVQRQVYALTPSVLPRGRMMAAALSYGSEAVLSHRAAAAIWDLGPWPTGFIDVTVPRTARPRIGTRVHVAQVERVSENGFPVTPPTRTLVDLAAVLPPGRLRDAFERAERLRLLDAKKVGEEIYGKRGAKKIRTIVAEWAEPEPTKSELEQAWRNLCRDHGLPLPSQNVVLLGYEVDAFFSEYGVVVELDSWEWHKTRRAFEEDRQKAVALEAAGYRVLRFSWRQVKREPAGLAAAIRSGCPRAGDRGRAPARAATRRPSVPSA